MVLLHCIDAPDARSHHERALLYSFTVSFISILTFGGFIPNNRSNASPAFIPMRALISFNCVVIIINIYIYNYNIFLIDYTFFVTEA